MPNGSIIWYHIYVLKFKRFLRCQMDRDRVLYHFSEEGDITYCSGEGQALATTGPRDITVARDRILSPSPYGKMGTK